MYCEKTDSIESITGLMQARCKAYEAFDENRGDEELAEAAYDAAVVYFEATIDTYDEAVQDLKKVVSVLRDADVHDVVQATQQILKDACVALADAYDVVSEAEGFVNMLLMWWCLRLTQATTPD